MRRYFGPFPDSFDNVTDDNKSAVVEIIQGMRPLIKPFMSSNAARLLSREGHFVPKIIKLDTGDRLTATQPLKENGSARNPRIQAGLRIRM